MTKKEKFKRIREDISIIEYAAKSGYTLVRKGRYYSLKEHDSLMIDPVKNVYWQNSRMGYGTCIGKKGSVIDFAVDFNGMSVYEALKEFEQMIGATTEKNEIDKQSKSSKELTDGIQETREIILPEKNGNMRKIFAYLIKTRHISKNVVQDTVHRRMLYQDVNGNCVFVGYDVYNPDKVIFGCRRGTNTYKKFIGDLLGCDYSKGFYVNNNNREALVVTESVIDALSVMSLLDGKYKEYNYLALGGTGKWEAVRTYLNIGKIKKVIMATDNDQGGVLCTQSICSCVRENYPNIDRKIKLPPEKYGKDWNDVVKSI